jgi:hypothetical protein
MMAERAGRAATAAAIVRKTRGEVVAVLGVDRDVAAALLELDAPAVEFLFHAATRGPWVAGRARLESRG